MKVEEKDFEPAGLIPRSIIRTVERFQQQLRPETIALGIQEFRISRYQVRVSVRYFFILLLLPVTINWGTKNFIIKPLVEYFWNTYGTSLFLNSYQAERAFQEMRDFESQLFFEMLLSNEDDLSKNLLPSTQVHTNTLNCDPLWSQTKDHPKKVSLLTSDLLSRQPLFNRLVPLGLPSHCSLWQGGSSGTEEFRLYERGIGNYGLRSKPLAQDRGVPKTRAPKELSTVEEHAGGYGLCPNPSACRGPSWCQRDHLAPLDLYHQSRHQYLNDQVKSPNGVVFSINDVKASKGLNPELTKPCKSQTQELWFWCRQRPLAKDFGEKTQLEPKSQLQRNPAHYRRKTKTLNVGKLQIGKNFFNKSSKVSCSYRCRSYCASSPCFTQQGEEANENTGQYPLFGAFDITWYQMSHVTSTQGQLVSLATKRDQYPNGLYKESFQYSQHPAAVHLPLYQKSRNILEKDRILSLDFANKNQCSLSSINKYFLSNLVEKSNDPTIPKLDLCFTTLFQQKTMLLAEIYNQQSITALSNMFGDCIMIVSIILLLRWNAPQFTILKSFLIESFYSFNDAIKCFYIILITDFLVGFHSPRGWEITMEMLLRHLGLPENEEFILLFVGTFPVFLDTAFKYWIFRYLNKISPSTVATYHSMIE